MKSSRDYFWGENLRSGENLERQVRLSNCAVNIKLIGNHQSLSTVMSQWEQSHKVMIKVLEPRPGLDADVET